jgi:dienelactone hydrolase
MRLFGGKQFGLGIVAMAVLFSWLSVAQGSEPLVVETPNSFAETQVAFSKKPAELQGTLTLPLKRNGKVPGIVFVGGDEPQNRTVPAGTEQMFADLARGLAQAGIASLRYQQRPFEFSAPADPKQLPLDQQIANDALAALAYLGHLPEIDSSAIFVVGHHVGGTMAPYVAERFPRARGIVLMAAAAQPVEEALAERKKATLQAEGLSSEEISEQLAAQNKIFADIRSGKTPSTRLVEGATSAYWRDRMNRDPGLKARNLQLPVLVLQGGFDKEISEADYDRLELLLRKKRGATPQFRWFPNLDHLFMPTATKPAQASLNHDRHVDGAVIQTVARWIKNQVR